MAPKLNNKAYEHARQLIEQGRFVRDDRDDWSADQPSANQENEFVAEHGFDHYAEWYLGVDEGKPKNTKERYSFPFGDFAKVHRGGVIAAEARAGQYKHSDIERAAVHLLGMLDESR